MVLIPFAQKSATPNPVAPNPAASLGEELIKETDTARFAEDVLQASIKTPVLVDFWAPWCGPCKQLGPLLEKIVREAKGAVRLVKIDVDKNQELAAQMRIQSIPAVYAFFGGQPVDGFVGSLPESQLRQFVTRLLKAAGNPAPGGGDELTQALEVAVSALAEGQAEEALALYRHIRSMAPESPAAYLGEVRALLQTGATEDAKKLLDAAPESVQKDKDYTSAKSAVELAAQGAASVGELAGLEAKLAAAPNDPEPRLALAVALYAAGKAAEAVDHLLYLVDHHRAWNEEAARKQLVKILEALGFDHPLAKDARRRMSAILFR